MATKCYQGVALIITAMLVVFCEAQQNAMQREYLACTNLIIICNIYLQRATTIKVLGYKGQMLCNVSYQKNNSVAIGLTYRFIQRFQVAL